MSVGMVLILLSTLPGQMKVITALLSKLHLSIRMTGKFGEDSQTVMWQWTASNRVDERQLVIKKRARIPATPKPSREFAHVTDTQGSKVDRHESERSPSEATDRQWSLKPIDEKSTNRSVPSALITPTVDSTSPIQDTQPLLCEKPATQQSVTTTNAARESADPPRPSQVQRKGMTEINQTDLRLCLEIGTSQIESDTNADLAYQLAFVELLLRGFVADSLQSFTTAFRASLKDIYRACTLTETLVKSTDLLWSGFRVGLWESKIEQARQLVRKQAGAGLTQVRASLQKARFDVPVSESNAGREYPRRVEATIRALAILSVDDKECEKSIHTLVQELGLHESGSSKRLVVFKCLQKPKDGAPSGILTEAETTRLRKLVADANLDSPLAQGEDNGFNTVILRETLSTMFDILYPHLPTYVRRSVGGGGNVAALQTALRDLVSKQDRGSQKIQGATAKTAQSIVTHALASVEICNLSNGESQRIGMLLQFDAKHSARWFKAQGDAESLARSSQPTKVRWYVEHPSRMPAEACHRFLFVGEADHAFEFAYVANNTASELPDAALLQRALLSWSKPPKMEIEGSEDSPKILVAFGLNHTFVGHSILGKEGLPTLSQILACPYIDAMAVGCHAPQAGRPGVVIARFYVQAQYAQQQSSTPDFLSYLQVASEIQKQTIRHGALPLVRFLALRDTHRHEPVLSLNGCVRNGDAPAQVALDAILRTSSRCQLLVMDCNVCHGILNLIIRFQVDTEYGLCYLRGLLQFVNTAAPGVIGEWLNQRFQHDSGVVALRDDPDVNDVLWFLACGNDEHPVEWRRAAQDVVMATFFLVEAQNRYRIFRYSLHVPLEWLYIKCREDGTLYVDSEDQMLALAGGRLEYYRNVVHIVQELTSRHERAITRTEVSKFDKAVAAKDAEEINVTIEQLLLRFFAVAQTEEGAVQLCASYEAVQLMSDLLTTKLLSHKLAEVVCNQVVFLSSLASRSVPLHSSLHEVSFVDTVVRLAWVVENPAITTSLVDALTHLQRVEKFRFQVFASLSRISGPLFTSGNSFLLQEVLPTAREESESTTIFRRRHVRFNAIVRQQHGAMTKCSHVAEPSDSLDNGKSVVRRVVAASIAKKMVTAIVQRVAESVAVSGRVYPVGSDRLLSVAIECRKAIKIQRLVLRWLYGSQDPMRHRLFRSSRSVTCAKCPTKQTFLSELYAHLHGLDLSETSDSRPQNQALVDTMCCFYFFTRINETSRLLVSAFRLQYGLLALAAHSSQRIRELAVVTLTAMCWESTMAREFISSRLTKSIWDNYAATLLRADPVQCSWIEHVLRLAVGKAHSRDGGEHGVAGTSSGVSQRSRVLTSRLASSGVDIEAAASLILVLSFSTENSNLLLKVAPLLSRNLATWAGPIDKSLRAQILLVLQNGFMFMKTLVGLQELAISVMDDLLRILPLVDQAADHVAHALVLGVVWVLCTSEPIRTAAIVRFPMLLGIIEETAQRYVLSTSTLLHQALALNAIGLLATLAIDGGAASISESMLKILQCRQPLTTDAGRNKYRDYESSTPRPAEAETPIFESEWASRCWRYGLLPRIGSRCSPLSLFELESELDNQMFRYVAVVAASAKYDFSVRNRAMAAFVQSLGAQLKRGGRTAKFALKALPHVIRAVSTSAKLFTDDRAVAVAEELEALVIISSGAPRLTPDQKSMPRQVVKALWHVQLLAHQTHTPPKTRMKHLIEMLHGADSDIKLRIAILGLLMKMFRGTSSPASSTQTVKSELSVGEKEQAEILRAVTTEVPLIMGVLRNQVEANRGMFRELDAWSPLSFEAIRTSVIGEESTRQEVVKDVRWPVELLNVLCESIFLDRIQVQVDYYDTLFDLLARLDDPSLRKAQIHGREQVVFQIARILRSLNERVQLSGNQPSRCIQALFNADSMMSYASDLAAICHASIDPSHCSVGHEALPDQNLLVATLRFMSCGQLRHDLLSSCLDIVSTIAITMGKEFFMTELKRYEAECGCAPSAMFGQVCTIFDGVAHSEAQWSATEKVLRLFGRLLRWDLFNSAYVSSEVASSRQRRMNPSVSKLLEIAIQLIPFKYWIEYAPTACHSAALRSCREAIGVVVSVIAQFSSVETTGTFPILGILENAFVKATTNRVLLSSEVKRPLLDILIYVFRVTYFHAKRAPTLPKETAQGIMHDAIHGLGLMAIQHKACHTVEMAQFFADNYEFPVLEEADFALRTKLVTLCRRCCCNAAIYRLLRLGKTSMWTRTEDSSGRDDDTTFFERLGISYNLATTPEASAPDDTMDEFRFNVMLFLVQRNFSISAAFRGEDAPSTAQVGSENSETRGSIDPSQVTLCLQGQFAESTANESRLSDNLTGFEAKLAKPIAVSQVAGLQVANEIIDILSKRWHTRVMTQTPAKTNPTNAQDSLKLFTVLSQVVRIASARVDRWKMESIHWDPLLQAIGYPALHLTELAAIYAFIEEFRHSAKCIPSITAVASAVTTRLGCASAQDASSQSFHATTSFLRSWGCRLVDEDLIELFSSPEWLKRLLLAISSRHLVTISLDAYSCLVELTRGASKSVVLAMIPVLRDWRHHPGFEQGMADSQPFSDSSITPICSTIWDALLTFLGPSGEPSDRVDQLQGSTLTLLYQLLDADPALVSERLLASSYLPALFSLLFSSSRSTQVQALSVLACLCSVHQAAALAMAQVVVSTVTQPFYNGPLEPLVGVLKTSSASPNEFKELKPPRDIATLFDLMMRQPVCIGLSKSDILRVSTMVARMRFRPGEVLLACGDQSSGSRQAQLMVIASGSVDWSLSVTQSMAGCRPPVLVDQARLVKGAIVGSSSLFRPRAHGDGRIVEHAVAVNDVVCLLLGEEIWKQREIGDRIVMSIARSSEAWKKHLLHLQQPRSTCYLDRLLHIACDHSSGNQQTSQEAVQLVVQLFHFIAHKEESERFLPGPCDWVIQRAMAAVHLEATTTLLRRHILQFLRAVVIQQPRTRRLIVSMGRESGRLDGVIVIASSFERCVGDPACLSTWLELVGLLVRSSDHDSQRMAQTFGRALSPNASIQLVRLCLTSDNSTNIGSLWSAIDLLSHALARFRVCLASLPESARLELAMRLVQLLTTAAAGNERSLAIGLLARCTTSPHFVVSMLGLAPPQVQERSAMCIDALVNFFTSESVEIPIDDDLSALHLVGNILRCSRVPASTKASLLASTNGTVKTILDRLLVTALRPDRASPLEECPVGAAILRVCAFIQTLDWCRHGLVEGRDTLPLLSSVIGSSEWVFAIESHVVSCVNGRLFGERGDLSSLLSAMRCIYNQSSHGQVPTHRSIEAVTALTNCQAYSAQKQVTATLVAALRMLSRAMTAADSPVSRPRKICDPFAYFTVELAVIESAMVNRSSLTLFTRHLQVLRKLCSEIKMTHSTQDGSVVEQLIGWLLERVCGGRSCGKVIRLAVASLVALLDQCQAVRQHLTTTCIIPILTRVFKSLADGNTGRRAKSRLLQVLCEVTQSEDLVNSAEVPLDVATGWTSCLLASVSECTFDDRASEPMTAVLIWLLGCFGDRCTPEGSNFEALLKAFLLPMLKASMRHYDNSVPGHLPEASLSAINLVLSLRCSTVEGVGVLAELFGTTLLWLTKLLVACYGGKNWTSQVQAFVYDSVRLINNTCADTRYHTAVMLALRPQAMALTKAAGSLLGNLSLETTARRCLVLDLLRNILRAVQGEDRRAIQVLLISTHQDPNSWLGCLTGDDLREAASSTHAMKLVCQWNTEVTRTLAQSSATPVNHIVANVRRGCDQLSVTSPPPHVAEAVLQLLLHSSSLLRHITRQLAQDQKTLEASPVYGAHESVRVLNTLQSSGVIAQLRQNTLGSMLMLLKDLCKYHVGCTRRELQGRMMETLHQVLVAVTWLLHSHQCTRYILVIKWLRKMLPRGSSALAGIDGVERLTASVGDCLAALVHHMHWIPSGAHRHSFLRTTEAVHAVIGIADVLGVDVCETLEQRGIPESTTHVLLRAYPCLVPYASASTVIACAYLGHHLLKRSVGSSTLSDSILSVMEDVRQGSHDTSASAKHGRLLVVSLQLWLQVVPADHDRDEALLCIVWDPVMACLSTTAQDQSSISRAASMATAISSLMRRSAARATSLSTELVALLSRVMPALAQAIARSATRLSARLLCTVLERLRRSMQSKPEPLSVQAMLEVYPSLIAALRETVARNDLLASHDLIGLICEILRTALSVQVDGSAVFALFNSLDELLLRFLRVRSTVEMPTQALACWYLLYRCRSGSLSIDRQSSAHVMSPSADLITAAGYHDHLVTCIDQLVTHHSSRLHVSLQGSLQTDSLDMVCKRLNALSSSDLAISVGPPLVSELTKYLTLDDTYPGDAREVLALWMVFKIVEELLMGDEHRHSFGRSFMERSQIISTVARIVELGDLLPVPLAVIILRLVARAFKTYRLFATPMADTISLPSVCRLLRSSDLATSTEAMRVLWQLLRSRHVCHRFLGAASSRTSDNQLVYAGLLFVKELVYTTELEPSRAEAIYGVLVQLVKHGSNLDAVLVMDELHPNAIFFEDPSDLLLPIAPFADSLVLLQQCRFVSHLSKHRPLALLKHSNLLSILRSALNADSEEGKDDVARHKAGSTALLVLLEATKDISPSSERDRLHLFIQDTDYLVLRECHRLLLCTVRAVDAVEFQDRERCKRLHLIATLGATFYHLSSSKRSLNTSQVIATSLPHFPKTLLLALQVLARLHQHERPGYKCALHKCVEHDVALSRRYILRTLRRLSHLPTVAEAFRTHDVLARTEPFDLLVRQLEHEFGSVRLARATIEPCLCELLIILLHITRDTEVSEAVASRDDAMSSLVHYLRCSTLVEGLQLVWQVLRNLVTQVVHVDRILRHVCGVTEHLHTLASAVRWSESSTRQLAIALTTSLVTIAKKSQDSHTHLLQFIPVLHAMLFHGPWYQVHHDSELSDATTLENIASILGLTMAACREDVNCFTQVLLLAERVTFIGLTEVNNGANAGPGERPGSCWSSHVLSAIERLVCALCDLLLSFHEAETRSTWLPGYEIKRLESTTANRPPGTTPHHGKTKPSLYVQRKKYGVYCKGYTPSTPALQDRILQIFTSACSLRLSWVASKRSHSHGKSDLPGHNCILVVSDFFFHLAHTPSGRFFVLHPRVIQFWSQHVPHMTKHSLLRLGETLLQSLLSKNQTLCFLHSGALRLLVVATCRCIRKAQGNSSRNATIVHDALRQFVVVAAVLTERSAFLQSTFYLVHAGSVDNITAATLVLAAVIHAAVSGAPYLKLACKVLSRFIAVYTLIETEGLLSSWPHQFVRALGWRHVTEEMVMAALITMIQQTEGEAIMKHRVLVHVIHSALLRTAVLGLIDKGIPEALHDYGLKTMMSQMESLDSACTAALEANAIAMAAASPEKPTRRRLSAGKTPVDKLAAGWNAVGGAALTAGANILVTTLQGEHSSKPETDPHEELDRSLGRCVTELRTLASEIAMYTSSGYPSVFKYFEGMNDDLELIATMQNSSHAIAFAQAAYYAIEILHEAIIAALAGKGGSAVPSAEAALNEDTLRDVRVFLQQVEAVLGWLAISLQHSDIDVLFFGHKAHLIGELLDHLLQLPVSDSGHDDSHDDQQSQSRRDGRQEPRRRRPAASDFVSLRKTRITEDASLFVRFHALELQSWLWAVLGFLPYLRVRHRDRVQIVRFTHRSVSSRSQSRRSTQVFGGYGCEFQAAWPDVDYVETAYRDLPHTVDVEVWVYLPFWYQDFLVSHAKVSLEATSLDTDSFSFQFYPERMRGLHTYQPEVVCTLSMELSMSRKQSVDSAGSVAADDLPAYSTLGSRWLRRLVRGGFDRVIGWLRNAFTRVSDKTNIQKLVETTNHRRHQQSSQAGPNPGTSLPGEALSTDQSMRESVGFLISEIVAVLREVTHPDKLIVPIAVSECEPLVARLEEQVPSIAAILAHAFETKHSHVWDHVVDALDVIKHCFLDKGLAFFESHLRHLQQRKREDGRAKSDAAVVPTDHTFTRRKTREKRQSGSLFARDSRVLPKTFRDVSSQLRFSHFLHRKPDQSSTLALKPDVGHLSTLSKLHSSIHSASSKRTQKMHTQSASTSVSVPYLSQYSPLKSERHLIYPHVSLWNLSHQEWHSLHRMAASTSLNHFLLQPIERLQVYCAVLLYLEPRVKARAEATMRTSSNSSVAQSAAVDTAPKQDGGPSVSTPPESPPRGNFVPGLVSKLRQKNHFAIVHKALAQTPEIDDFHQLEALRARRLLKYHAMDPFDAAARLQRLYQDASQLPEILYRSGAIATIVHGSVWVLLALTVWRFSVACDTVRDSQRSFQELFLAQLHGGDSDSLHHTGEGRRHQIQITDRRRSVGVPSHHGKKHQVAPSAATVSESESLAGSTQSKTQQPSSRHALFLSQQELKHLVVLQELKSLQSDICRVWPTENGNIGLGGFWSSLAFTLLAIGSPFLLLYAVFPWLLQRSPANVTVLSSIACAYGSLWIVLAFFSILGVTRKIPAFREVRRVEQINLTEFPYCVRNYMAIASAVWEGFQLNATAFSVWDMSYRPKQLVALTTIDLQDLGLGSLHVDVFAAKQSVALACLAAWFLCLKASNKFKSRPYVNYVATFLLPNLLGGMLFMFLSKQFYQSAACFQDATTGRTVLWGDAAIECWTSDRHVAYALRGLLGMGVFVPLAVLAFGSYQVFFPEVNLDVQTSPVLNVSAQIAKAAMMGALTFFVDRVKLFLAVSLVGNLLLLALVSKYDVCSTWHLKYFKVLIYAMSSWSALCAMASSFVPEQERHRVPLATMHIGWGVHVLVALLCVRRRRRQRAKQRHVRGLRQ